MQFTFYIILNRTGFLRNFVIIVFKLLLLYRFHEFFLYYFYIRKRAYPEEDSIKMSAKKLINNPEHVVDEALEGLLRINPGVQGIENHRVVVRSDLQNVENRVAILCGGGSGHEPAFAGNFQLHEKKNQLFIVDFSREKQNNNNPFHVKKSLTYVCNLVDFFR